MRENDHGKVFVANLSSVPISSVEEFDALYAYVDIHPYNKFIEVILVDTGKPRNIALQGQPI